MATTVPSRKARRGRWDDGRAGAGAGGAGQARRPAGAGAPPGHDLLALHPPPVRRPRHGPGPRGDAAGAGAGSPSSPRARPWSRSSRRSSSPTGAWVVAPPSPSRSRGCGTGPIRRRCTASTNLGSTIAAHAPVPLLAGAPGEASVPLWSLGPGAEPFAFITLRYAIRYDGDRCSLERHWHPDDRWTVEPRGWSCTRRRRRSTGCWRPGRCWRT